MARRLWLIDAGYLFNAQSSVRHGFQFDYKKLRDRLEADGAIWRAYYLNAIQQPTSDATDAFHAFLRSAPPRGPKIITKLYELKEQRLDRGYCETCATLVELECPHRAANGGHNLRYQQQKGVDVGLATLALTLASEYDTLLLSSGDGDFLDMFEYLSVHGKQLQLAVFRQGVSTELQARSDLIYWIDDFAADVQR